MANFTACGTELALNIAIGFVPVVTCSCPLGMLIGACLHHLVQKRQWCKWRSSSEKIRSKQSDDKQAEIPQSRETAAVNPVHVMLEKNLSYNLVSMIPSKRSLVPPQTRKRDTKLDKQHLNDSVTDVSTTQIKGEDLNAETVDQSMSKSYGKEERACPLYSEPGKTHSQGNLGHMYTEVSGTKPKHAYNELNTMGRQTWR